MQGSLVFGNAQNMKKLTDIVWPELKKLLEIRINNLANEGWVIVFKIKLLL